MTIADRVIVLGLFLSGFAAHAQGPVDAVSSSACLEHPTQACLLDEALELLLRPTSVILFPSGARKYDLEKIVELHANAGRFALARRVTQTIDSRDLSRVYALRSIGLAQANAGASQDAADSFDQAHQLIDARDKDPLGQAGLLLAMARAEDEAGLKAAAIASLAESLELAIRTDVNVYGCIDPFLNARLDGLLKTLAEEHAKRGDVANAVRAARATGYATYTRADALRVAAGARSARGEFVEARLLLLEAVDALKASILRPPPSSKCPRQVVLADLSIYIQQLSQVAVAQTKAGFADDATASFAAASSAVDNIETAYSLGKELRRSQALSEIAEAMHAARPGAPAMEAFDRAVEAANAVADMRSASTALIRLAQAQHRTGRIEDARATLVRALEQARAVDGNDLKAVAILNVADAGFVPGLATVADGALGEALSAAGQATDRGRFQLFRRIAQIKLRSGATEEAVALFGDLLRAVETTDGERQRSTAFATVMRGWPMLEGGVLIMRVEKQLIAGNAQQAVRLAYSVRDAIQRAAVLVIVAEGLPD